MTAKTRNIINWVLAIIVSFIFVGSGISKLTADSTALAEAAKIGLSPNTLTILGVIELLAVALFLYPRTGIIGALVLVAYMGGAVCAHVVFGLPIIAPVVISIFVWIVSVVRFPELTNRLTGKI